MIIHVHSQNKIHIPSDMMKTDSEYSICIVVDERGNVYLLHVIAQHLTKTWLPFTTNATDLCYGDKSVTCTCTTYTTVLRHRPFSNQFVYLTMCFMHGWS